MWLWAWPLPAAALAKADCYFRQTFKVCRNGVELHGIYGRRSLADFIPKWTFLLLYAMKREKWQYRHNWPTRTLWIFLSVPVWRDAVFMGWPWRQSMLLP